LRGFTFTTRTIGLGVALIGVLLGLCPTKDLCDKVLSGRYLIGAEEIWIFPRGGEEFGCRGGTKRFLWRQGPKENWGWSKGQNF